jgi:hypothetical protein
MKEIKQKPILTGILCAMFWIMLVYGAISFLNWDFNPKLWSYEYKMDLIMFGFGLGFLFGILIAACIIVNRDTDNKKTP